MNDIISIRRMNKWEVKCSDELKEFFEDKDKDIFDYLYEFEIYGIIDFKPVGEFKYKMELSEDGKNLLRILKEIDGEEV